MERSESAVTAVTSLNPFSRIETQLRCFQAWKALGVRILTVNVDDEADRLIPLGLAEADILRLSAADTGQALHGKPVPQILATLRRLREQPGTGPVAVVNSDLFPAMRSPAGLGHWLDHFPAMALTREDCGAAETVRFGDRAPYRGGLDAFVFSRASLAQVLERAGTSTSAGRMCFGMIGWDYVMGALILSAGGGLADSGLLLHERHPTTYSSMDEFAHYLPDMRRLAGIETENPTEAAAIFQRVIEWECDRSAPLTARMQMMFLAPPRAATLPDAAAMALADRLLRLCPVQGWVTRRGSIAHLATEARTAGACDLPWARDVFEVNPDPHHRFSQRLLAILFCLECRDLFTPGPVPVRTQYPEGNLHGKAIRHLRETLADDPRMLQLEITSVFGAELVEHGIFNPRIFNYLVQGCECDDERLLLREILSHAQGVRHAA
ncbi:hypothetical protein [Sedimentitalea todarodis]|uniref:Glycosyl transferase family 2 n=1 Tax=Sedimentitalea todarodis TaxID=1631240 RepID=A0ABU3VK08_9RHOB|nr:hypothetical protein [Sedimentitalea todarodis]MDU9006527.1 hypothetical protein [Sedimentitalea todarodis]